MNKLIVDGKVAVIVSPGFGAGWSTCGDEESCLDGELAQAILDGLHEDKIEEIAEKNWPGQYQGGLYQCVVKWVEQGEQFEITDYDGNESLNIIGMNRYMTA